MRGAAAVLAVAFGLWLTGPAASQDAGDRAYDCVVEPSLTVKLGSPVSGRLSEVMVDRGSIVSRGQVVARMHDELERATVLLNETRAKGTAQLDADRARLRLARKQLDRSEKLFKKKVMAMDAVEEARSQVEVGKQNVRRSALDIRLAELELERSKVQLATRTIKSPIDGIVTQRLLSAGEYVRQEAYIMEIAQLDPLFVEVFLPVSLYGQVQVGGTADVTIQKPIGGTYKASVGVVDKVLDAASGTFGVRLTLPNPGYRLPAGIRCQARFQGRAASSQEGKAGGGDGKGRSPA